MLPFVFFLIFSIRFRSFFFVHLSLIFKFDMPLLIQFIITRLWFTSIRVRRRPPALCTWILWAEHATFKSSSMNDFCETLFQVRSFLFIKTNIIFSISVLRVWSLDRSPGAPHTFLFKYNEPLGKVEQVRVYFRPSVKNRVIGVFRKDKLLIDQIEFNYMSNIDPQYGFALFFFSLITIGIVSIVNHQIYLHQFCFAMILILRLCNQSECVDLWAVVCAHKQVPELRCPRTANKKSSLVNAGRESCHGPASRTHWPQPTSRRPAMPDLRRLATNHSVDPIPPDFTLFNRVSIKSFAWILLLIFLNSN